MAQQTFEEIVAAVKQAESRGKRYAADGKTLTTSPKGALGEMQVMPKTITDPGFGVAPAKDKSPDEIARVGRDYLQAMLGKYGDTEKALVAYNWGPGATDKWLASGAKPEALPAETRTYVQRVKGLLGKDVPRETMAKKDREPLPPSLPPMAQAEPKAATVAMASGKNLPDIKSLPPSYQAAFALAALADAQDEEDDRVYNENKSTETEEFFANYKPVNRLASLDLEVKPVMMAKGGDVSAEQERLTPQQIERIAAQGPTERKDEPFFDAASRTYVDVLTGRRTPITEKDFTAKEQMAMMDAVRRSQARGGKGRVDYEDYPDSNTVGPGYVDIRNTLGGFQYKQGPDGATIISDRYDFHGPRVAEYEKMGTGEKVLKSAKNALTEFVTKGFSPRDLAGELGRAYVGSKGPEVNIRIPVNRAEGSPEEGERLTPQQIERIAAQEAASREQASTAAFISQKSGIGRKEGNISKALRSGEGQVEMAKGLTMMPQNILGAPVDLATMAMRPFGYDVEKPFMGSEYLKEKSRAAGVAFKPSEDPTLAGFFEAGNISSGLVNPAGVARTGVKAAEKTGEAAKMLAKDFQKYNQELAVPGASYIRRPAGGVFPTAKGPDEAPVSALDIAMGKTLESLDYVQATPEAKEATKQFFNTKMFDYFKTKASSVSDPVREALINGRIKIPKDTPLEEQFPQALLSAARAGDVTAMRDIENRFDTMMGVKSYRVKQAGEGYEGSTIAQEGFNQTILQQMKANPSVIPDEFLLRLAKKDVSKLSKQEQAAEVATIRQKLADNPTLFSTVFEPKIARLLEEKSVESITPDFLARNENYYPALANAKSRQEGIMALQADVPITDLESRHRLPDMFGMDYATMVEQATKMDPKELARMSVPEFLAKAVPAIAKEKDFARKAERVESLVKAGKPVPAEIGQFGTKEFLPTDPNGMTWREITDPQAAIVQSHFLDNSMRGYAKPGTYGSLNKGSTALKDGEVRLFSLYDKDGNAVTNVEFVTPKVANNPDHKNKANTITQMYGNGLRTGNVTPEKYPAQMLDLVNALQPKNIPPSIKQLFNDNGLIVTPVEPPQNAARTIQMNMFQPPAQRADGGMIERQPNDNRRYL